MAKWLSVLCIVLCVPFGCAATELYKCTAGGKVIYQHGPCREQQDERKLTVQGGAAASATVQPQKRIEPKARRRTLRRDADGRIKRSQTAKNRFKRLHPCPANGRRSGACPGYVIDHIVALACGGADEPGNMQWQTAAAAKAKDKWERKGCR